MLTVFHCNHINSNMFVLREVSIETEIASGQSHLNIVFVNIALITIMAHFLNTQKATVNQYHSAVIIYLVSI